MIYNIEDNAKKNCKPKYQASLKTISIVDITYLKINCIIYDNHVNIFVSQHRLGALWFKTKLTILISIALPFNM